VGLSRANRALLRMYPSLNRKNVGSIQGKRYALQITAASEQSQEECPMPLPESEPRNPPERELRTYYRQTGTFMSRNVRIADLTPTTGGRLGKPFMEQLAKVRLTARQAAYLSDLIATDTSFAALFRTSERIRFEPDAIVLDRTGAEILDDFLGERLAERGFDARYEEGSLLEGLIDALFAVLGK